MYFPPDSTTCNVELNYSGSSAPSSAELSGNLTPKYNSYIKGFNITSILFIAKPPATLQVKLSCPSIIKIPNSSNSGSYTTNYSFPISINMRSCNKLIIIRLYWIKTFLWFFKKNRYPWRNLFSFSWNLLDMQIITILVGFRSWELSFMSNLWCWWMSWCECN